MSSQPVLADDEEIQRIYQAARLGKTKAVKEALDAGRIPADYADAKVSISCLGDC
jgi:hypothetical protein